MALETTPEVSIVVLTRRAGLPVARLLRSLGRADGIERAELLLGVNGGNGNAEQDFLRRQAERYLPETRVVVRNIVRAWPGVARNSLAHTAAAPILLFLDDDVEVPPQLLRSTVAAFEDAGVVVAGGPNLTPPKAGASEQLAGAVLSSLLGTGPVRRRYRQGPSRVAGERALALCNLAVRRRAFEGVEFDRGLACAEENELLRRLSRVGVFVHDPGLAVYHHRRERQRAHLRQMLKYGFGRGQLIARAPSPAQLPYLLPSLAVAAVGLLAGLGASLVAAGIAAGYLLAVAATASVLGRRRLLQAAGFLLSTHLGYAVGVVGGLADGVTRPALRLGRLRGDRRRRPVRVAEQQP